MLKRVLSLVLVSVMAISLFACGGGKEIEMNGNEAKSILGCEFESCNVELPKNEKEIRDNTVLQDLYVELVFKLNIKDEYKNEYNLNKIVTIDTNKIEGVREIKVNRDKKTCSFIVLAGVEGFSSTNYQVSMSAFHAYYDFDSKPSLNQISDKIQKDKNFMKKISTEVAKMNWISNVHLKLNEK